MHFVVNLLKPRVLNKNRRKTEMERRNHMKILFK